MIALDPHEVTLCTWPCGCTLPFEEPPHALWHVAYQCRWCDAVVSRPDLSRWFAEAQMAPPMFGVNRPLLRLGESLVEAGEACHCGSPMVRELRSGAKWGHLRVPLSKVEVLHD